MTNSTTIRATPMIVGMIQASMIPQKTDRDQPLPGVTVMTRAYERKNLPHAGQVSAKFEQLC